MSLDALLKQFDGYDLKARLFPALLVFAPLGVVCACLYSDQWTAIGAALSILGTCGITYLLARFSRNSGRKLQDQLFTKWGGAPTTQLLRHKNEHFDIHTKMELHAAISTLFGLNLPSRESEAADPAAADELYRAGVGKLINATRDAKVYPLVLKENISFGFHRNGLAIRWLGILVSFLALLWVLVFAGVTSAQPPFIRPFGEWTLSVKVSACAAVSVLGLFAWTFVISEAGAKSAAFAYAERLIQCCDQLTQLQKPVANKSPKKSTGPKERS